MTVITEGKDSLYLTSSAMLIDNDRDIASWASTHIQSNKNIKWILGKYVEADNANSNGQYWEYNDLRLSQPSITHSPMNLDHQRKNIVGTWVASEMMYPNKEKAEQTNPYIETLGAFWKWYFPEELKIVQDAFDGGNLYVSMECVSESVTCGGPDGCGETFDYAGPMSDTYCQHIQDRASYRQLNKSQFLGGALILPGNKPGWKAADVKEISKLTTDEEKDQILADIAKMQTSGTPSDWERTMWAIQMQGVLAQAKK